MAISKLSIDGRPTSCSIIRSPFVHYEMVRFFNEEVLVMMAAAVWGSFVPVSYPDEINNVWAKALVAIFACAFCGFLQVTLVFLLRRCTRGQASFKRSRQEQVMEFLIGILVWQPRVSWAMLGKSMSTAVQEFVTGAIGSPAAGILMSFVLAYVLFRVGARVNYIARLLGDRLWAYPLQTFCMSNLQMCAKICYVSWLGLSSKISSSEHGHEDVRQQAAHSFWCLWFLLAMTYVIHSMLKENINAAAADPGRGEEAWRLQKEAWFICFIWASGFPDTSQAILVDYVGGELLQDRMQGVYLLYLWSSLLFIICALVALKVYLNGRVAILVLHPGDLSGLEWKDGKDPGTVHLVGVRKGSPAQKQGFQKLEGHRILRIDGVCVDNVAHAQQLESSNCTVLDASDPSCTCMRKTYVFKSYQTVIEAMVEGIGETAAVFTSNGLNNMYWWAIQEQVMELFPNFKHGGLWCFILAMFLTALSVAVFSVNCARWEHVLGRSGGYSIDKLLWGWQHTDAQKFQHARSKWKDAKKVLVATQLRGSPGLRDALLINKSGGEPAHDAPAHHRDAPERRQRDGTNTHDAGCFPGYDSKAFAGPFLHVSPVLAKALERQATGSVQAAQAEESSNLQDEHHQQVSKVGARGWCCRRQHSCM